jgi:GAF domain-containing protein
MRLAHHPGAIVPANPESLSEGLQALSRFFVGDATLRETLEKVAALACAALPATDMVGITMLVEGRARTAVFTDETAPQIDSAQYETGSGPCLDAFRHQQVYKIDDMEKDVQWPAFSEAAAAHGVNSSLSVPLLARHEGLGALNFYSPTSAAYSDEDVTTALQFATQAAIVLSNAQAYWDAQQLGQDMAEAMKSRATIEQAKGILMGAQRCSAEEAFQILVRASQRENRKLREIADAIVARTAESRPGPAPS